MPVNCQILYIGRCRPIYSLVRITLSKIYSHSLVELGLNRAIRAFQVPIMESSGQGLPGTRSTYPPVLASRPRLS
jgi:hypothetical protein